MNNVVTLLVLTLALGPLAARAEVVTDSKTFLKEQLGANPKKAKENFSLSPAQRKELVAIAERASDTAFTFYYGKSDKDQLKVACTIVPQEGKEGPMQIGICFDGAGLVTAVRIIEFQEDHGKAVKEMAFLKQFNGKKSAATFRVGKDVDAVSGATRSSEAVSEAVRKASYGFNQFVGKKGAGQ